MSPSIMQILVVVMLAVLLFGRGKISGLMGDVAKGINAFKRGMKDAAEEDAAEVAEKRAIEKDRDAIDVASRETKAESANR